MLPNKRQKHKTKVRQGNNPQFLESFLLHRVNPGMLISKQRQTKSEKLYVNEIRKYKSNNSYYKA
jgi:hypothetical protein